MYRKPGRVTPRRSLFLYLEKEIWEPTSPAVKGSFLKAINLPGPSSMIRLRNLRAPFGLETPINSPRSTQRPRPKILHLCQLDSSKSQLLGMLILHVLWSLNLSVLLFEASSSRPSCCLAKAPMIHDRFCGPGCAPNAKSRLSMIPSISKAS